MADVLMSLYPDIELAFVDDNAMADEKNITLMC